MGAAAAGAEGGRVKGYCRGERIMGHGADGLIVSAFGMGI